MIISIGAEIAFDKIQHPLIIKALNKLGLEGTYLIIKGHICQVLSNILHSKRLQPFPLRSGTKGAFPFLQILLNIVTGSPSYRKK